MADYQVLITNNAGVPYAEISNVVIESVTWELNGWGEAVFSMSVTDAQAWTELRPSYQTKREVQIWRNGRLIWWGIYVAGSADQTTVTFMAYGLLWYFSRRYFGPVHSNTMAQLLSNGNFESAVGTGWTAGGPTALFATTTRRRSGSQAWRLTTTGVAGTECYISQAVTVPTPARTRPLTFTFSAWVYVETVTNAHFTNNALVLGPGGSSALTAARLEPTDPFNTWIFKEMQYIVPAGSTTSLVAVLYGPATGVVYWDDARVTYEQKTGAIEGEDWSDAYFRRISSLGAGITSGGAGTVCWGAPVNKDPLNMTFTGSGSAAGSLRADLFWNHADEGNIGQAMTEIVARNVMDFEITWPTNGRSRTITTYPPRKGTTKVGLAAEDGKNVMGWRYSCDGRRRASDVRVSGRGPGKVREEGQAGGPTVVFPPQLETVLSPTFELAGQPLIDTAAAELARLTDPVKVPTLTVQAGMYMGDIQSGGTAEAGAPLAVGDTIPVRISHGWVQEAANRRVMKMTLRPATETLELTFNDN